MAGPEPVWVELDAVLAAHARSLALHGGAEGYRDLGLLESALQRPRNRFVYDGVEDLAELAASYAIAVSANHPFADGNKRAAFLCMMLFLRANGRRLEIDAVEAIRLFFALADGKVDLAGLTDWVRARLVP